MAVIDKLDRQTEYKLEHSQYSFKMSHKCIFYGKQCKKLIIWSFNPCSAGNEIIYLCKQIRPRSEYEGEFTPVAYIDLAIFQNWNSPF